MLIQKIIFYLSFLVFPFILGLSYLTYKKGRSILKKKLLILLIVFLFSLSLLFTYARFIEPNIILTKTTKIETGFSAKVVVISDIHLGIYTKKGLLDRTIEKVNQIDGVDFVLIPGDFTFYPSQDLEILFSPLKDLKYPAFAVLGNHDSEKPGPPIQKELQAVLEKFNITFLHNTNAEIKGIKILGLGDRWANEDDVSKIDDFDEADNLIVVAHNPDTTYRYQNSIPDLTVSGHTHGGQIRLPFIYRNAIPSEYSFNQGLYQTSSGKIFVSTGLGTTGLPMRLGIPPTIDILELY